MPRVAPNPATLEEARQMLLQNTDELNQMDEKIENFNSQITEKVKEIDSLRTLNQQLYLRLPQATAENPRKNEKPEDTESLEDFARNKLKGMIR